MSEEITELPMGNPVPPRPGSRVIRSTPGRGIPFDPGHFDFENVDQLAAALMAHTDGRIQELQAAAEHLEARLRAAAEEARQRIARALKRTDEAVARRIDDTARRGREVLAECRRRGEEEGHREGFRKGYDEGLQAGLEEGRARGGEEAFREVEARLRAEIEPARASVLSLEKQWRERWAEHFEGVHQALIEVATAMAEQVIRREVRECPEIIEEKVRDAVDRVGSDYRLRIEIHPDDREAVARYLEGETRLKGNESVEFITSTDVGRGGCRVSNKSSSVDLTVETQLEVLGRRLICARGGP